MDYRLMKEVMSPILSGWSEMQSISFNILKQLISQSGYRGYWTQCWCGDCRNSSI
ncbi:hypothetical protein RHO15_07175 [Utexia brackfieldae]|uniref:hypothetical protein n=1 Tax=Utexia brackfieldae TaxID=3074108 RepID=UPI00370D49F5